MRERRARVVYSYKPVNDDELRLEVGDVIDVLDEVEEGWWRGNLKGRVGVFPSNFVKEMTEEDTQVAPRGQSPAMGTGGVRASTRTQEIGDSVSPSSPLSSGDDLDRPTGGSSSSLGNHKREDSAGEIKPKRVP